MKRWLSDRLSELIELLRLLLARTQRTQNGVTKYHK